MMSGPDNHLLVSHLRPIGGVAPGPHSSEATSATEDNMRWLLRVLLLGQAAGGIAQQPVARRSNASAQQGVTSVRRATVTISVTRPDGDAFGSGFVVTS